MPVDVLGQRSRTELLNDYRLVVESLGRDKADKSFQGYVQSRIQVIRARLERVLPPVQKDHIRGLHVKVPICDDCKHALYRYVNGAPTIEMSTGFVRYMFNFSEYLTSFGSSLTLDYYWNLGEYEYLIEENFDRITAHYPVDQFVTETSIDKETFAKLFLRPSEYDESIPKGETACLVIFYLDSILAFVLAHEMAHHILGHGHRQPNSASESRDRERQADEWAVELLTRSGVSPMGGVLFLAALAARYQFGHSWLYLSHPNVFSRLETIGVATVQAFKKYKYVQRERIESEAALEMDSVLANFDSLMHILNDPTPSPHRNEIEKKRTSVITTPSANFILSTDFQVVVNALVAASDQSRHVNDLSFDGTYWTLAVEKEESKSGQMIGIHSSEDHVDQEINRQLSRGLSLDYSDCSIRHCITVFNHEYSSSVTVSKRNTLDYGYSSVRSSGGTVRDVFYGFGHWYFVLENGPDGADSFDVMLGSSISDLFVRLQYDHVKNRRIQTIDCFKKGCIAVFQQEQSTTLVDRRLLSAKSIYELRKIAYGLFQDTSFEEIEDPISITKPQFSTGKWYMIAEY